MMRTRKPTKEGGILGRHCQLEILHLRQVLGDFIARPVPYVDTIGENVGDPSSSSILLGLCFTAGVPDS
jgi:hypothetical protein